MLVFLATILLNIHLYVTIPKGFFPQQDTGRIVGGIRGDQSISFQAMQKKFQQFVDIINKTLVKPPRSFTRGWPAR